MRFISLYHGWHLFCRISVSYGIFSFAQLSLGSSLSSQYLGSKCNKAFDSVFLVGKWLLRYGFLAKRSSTYEAQYGVRLSTKLFNVWLWALMQACHTWVGTIGSFRNHMGGGRKGESFRNHPACGWEKGKTLSNYASHEHEKERISKTTSDTDRKKIAFEQGRPIWASKGKMSATLPCVLKQIQFQRGTYVKRSVTWSLIGCTWDSDRHILWVPRNIHTNCAKQPHNPEVVIIMCITSAVRLLKEDFPC